MVNCNKRVTTSRSLYMLQGAVALTRWQTHVSLQLAGQCWCALEAMLLTTTSDGQEIPRNIGVPTR